MGMATNFAGSLKTESFAKGLLLVVVTAILTVINCFLSETVNGTLSKLILLNTRKELLYILTWNPNDMVDYSMLKSFSRYH